MENFITEGIYIFSFLLLQVAWKTLVNFLYHNTWNPTLFITAYVVPDKILATYDT